MPGVSANTCTRPRAYKLPAQALQAIGNLAEEYSTEPKEYYWDVAKSIDWDAGDFGDDGSCFWGCREGR